MSDSKNGHAVDVVREGKWWMVHIPDFGGLTQARRLGEVTTMAREWIALETGAAIEDVSVWLRRLDVEGSDVARTRDAIVAKRQEIAELEGQLTDLNVATAKSLAAAGVPVRDVAEVLGVSFQRVSQIVNA